MSMSTPPTTPLTSKRPRGAGTGVRVLVIGGVVLVLAMVVLWKQVGSSSAEPVVTPVAAIPLPPPLPEVRSHAAHAVAVPSDAIPAVAAAAPEKVAVQSQEFFYQFSELVVPNVSRNAVKCIESQPRHLQMNQDARYLFDIAVRGGQVTISNVRQAESTIGDPVIEDCFRTAILKTAWANAQLPDYEEKDHEVTFSPERGMKKYRQDNINYVGKELSAPSR